MLHESEQGSKKGWTWHSDRPGYEILPLLVIKFKVFSVHSSIKVGWYFLHRMVRMETDAM